LLVVLVGIAAMHAGVFTVGHGAQYRAPEHHGIVAMVSDAHPSSVTGEHALGHGAEHACVFILSAVGFVFGLVLLYRLGAHLPGYHAPRSRHRRPRRERPPPWTVPTLAELSIRRI
jgi:hypothetical protein